LSLWELAVAVDGYNRANGGDELEPLTVEEYEADMLRAAERGWLH
jgi:hypothetical protein